MSLPNSFQGTKGGCPFERSWVFQREAFGKKWRKMERDNLKRLGVDGYGID